MVIKRLHKIVTGHKGRPYGVDQTAMSLEATGGVPLTIFTNIAAKVTNACIRIMNSMVTMALS